MKRSLRLNSFRPLQSSLTTYTLEASWINRKGAEPVTILFQNFPIDAESPEGQFIAAGMIAKALGEKANVELKLVSARRASPGGAMLVECTAADHDRFCATSTSQNLRFSIAEAVVSVINKIIEHQAKPPVELGVSG